jgi:amidophosphoribosyltransferase
MTDSLHEECGLFGIYNHSHAAESTFLGIYALQHRGQESAGIVSTDGKRTFEHKGMGLISQVFNEENLQKLEGHIAIGHNRYSTTGQPRVANVQPLLVDCKVGKLAMAHNGNLVNARELRADMEKSGSIFNTTMDSEVIMHLIARSQQPTLEKMIVEAVNQLRGAFSLLMMTNKELIAVRDPQSLRPLCMGQQGDSIIITSESCALDIVGAEYVRDLNPGEIVVVDEQGVRSMQAFDETKQAKCIFEFIYFSRPDSRVFGEKVDKIRRRLGHVLATNHPVEADIVISVPDSSNTSSLGFSQESKIPFELGLIRNHYVGRTFIQPSQTLREGTVRLKFNTVAGVLKGKRVAVVDDSIVRGSTMKKLVVMLRNAGATEVHLRIASPPIRFPCYYGIDMPSSAELIASAKSVEEISKFLGVDSLEYLTLEDLRSCVDDPENFCYACFSGEYPVPLSPDLDKSALEKDPVIRT